MNNKLSADAQAAAWNPNDKEREATTYAAIIIDFLSKVIHGLSTGAVYDGIELNIESAKSFFNKLVKVLEVKETRIAGATAEAERAQVLVDALEQAKIVISLYKDLYNASQERACLQQIEKALQQWKDQKEVEPLAEQVYPDRCTCRYPSFNPMTDRCLICNRLNNPPK